MAQLPHYQEVIFLYIPMTHTGFSTLFSTILLLFWNTYFPFWSCARQILLLASCLTSHGASVHVAK